MRVLALNPPQVTRCWRNMPASYHTAPRHLPHLVRGRRAGRRMDQPFISSRSVANIIADPRVQGRGADRSEKRGAPWRYQARRSNNKNRRWNWRNDAFVVLDDADLEKAVKITCRHDSLMQGQVCTAAKRFILHEKIADQFSASSPRRSGR